MPIRMDSVVVPELPDIKSEIKAEDFCSVAVVGSAPPPPPPPPNAGSNPNGDSTVPDVSQSSGNNATATPPITSQLDQQMQHHQQQPDTCNWVGLFSLHISLLENYVVWIS